MRSIMFKLSAAALAVAVSMAAPPAQPHIVIFIVDDFGWANIGIHRNVTNDPRHEVQTPNMDALAATGLTLDRNYLFWYCSPSRSALQTGRNPIHVNVDNSDSALSSGWGCAPLSDPHKAEYNKVPVLTEIVCRTLLPHAHPPSPFLHACSAAIQPCRPCRRLRRYD